MIGSSPVITYTWVFAQGNLFWRASRYPGTPITPGRLADHVVGGRTGNAEPR
jgi:hypothetical protein